VSFNSNEFLSVCIVLLIVMFMYRIIEIGCGVRFVNLRSRSVVCLVMESVTCIIAFMR